MSKHHKHRRVERPSQDLAQDPTGVAPAAWRARVESLLAAGKSREAVEAAKQFLKETRSPEAESVVVVAYEARIRALMAKGMYRDARALAAMVGERFRAYRDRVAPLMRQSELLSGGSFEPLLAELSSADPPRRHELEAILTRELADPAVLADSPALPVDDPLRRAARLVRELFTAVTTAPLPPGALARLDEIPRHSPLAPWKLLIRALDAFYRRADAAALANLSAIPAPSGPARLVPVIRRLLGAPPPPGDRSDRSEDRSLAVTTLLDRVTGGHAPLQARLRRLIPALAAKDERTGLAVVQDLLYVLKASPPALRRTFIATVLHHWHRGGLNPGPLLDTLLRSARDPDTPRLIALAMEREGLWDLAVHFWDRYLGAAIRADIFPGASHEASRVLLHMAGLFPPDPADVLDFFDVASEGELRSLIRAKAVPACFDRADLLERARAAGPDPCVFRALVAHYEKREPKRAKAEAQAWRRAHPRDLEPLLLLIRAAERRGAHRSALNLVAEAEALNRVHPEVRQSRFRLLVASAERRIREARADLAAADLDRLEQEPRAGEGDHMAYLLALRWAAARRAADDHGAAGAAQALAGRLGNPVLVDLTLGAVAARLGIEPPEPPGTPSPPQAVEGLARACDLFRELDRPLEVPRELLTQVERDLGGASPAQLHALCAGGLSIGRPALTYAASGQGLADDGALVPRFLLARGQALGAAMAARDRERARPCLRAARELAGRARDMETVREASAALEMLPAGAEPDPWTRALPPVDEAPPTQEEITRIVAAERRQRGMPLFMAGAAPRKPRRRRRPRQRTLFDDLFALFEGAR